MKIIKTASGKKRIKISKKEWESIGKTAGWRGFSPSTSFQEEFEIETGDGDSIDADLEIEYDYDDVEPARPVEITKVELINPISFISPLTNETVSFGSGAIEENKDFMRHTTGIDDVAKAEEEFIKRLWVATERHWEHWSSWDEVMKRKRDDY